MVTDVADHLRLVQSRQIELTTKTANLDLVPISEGQKGSKWWTFRTGSMETNSKPDVQTKVPLDDGPTGQEQDNGQTQFGHM